jgi:hypothetical protein
MITRYLTTVLASSIITFLLATTAHAQRTIPFRIASVDPAAKFSFADWPVLGKFEGIVEISGEGKGSLLKVKLSGGELVASKAPKTVLEITPFLAKPYRKAFKKVDTAKAAFLRQTLEVGIPLKLEPYEFVIEVKDPKDLSKYWLGFQVRLECPHQACYVYAHSPAEIFAK